jgi:hypothetical protein
MTITTVGIAKNVFAVHCIEWKLALGPTIGQGYSQALGYSGDGWKFVSPYGMAGKTGKNDAADAIAICEAVQRPHMRFVPAKDESQQAMQCLHRTRQGFIQERTATYNRLRGLISEFGVIAPQSTDALRHVVSDQKETLPVQVRLCIDDLLTHVTNIEEKIAEYDRYYLVWPKQIIAASS